jgi:hypothetical protein
VSSLNGDSVPFVVYTTLKKGKPSCDLHAPWACHSLQLVRARCFPVLLAKTTHKVTIISFHWVGQL